MMLGAQPNFFHFHAVFSKNVAKLYVCASNSGVEILDPPLISVVQVIPGH